MAKVVEIAPAAVALADVYLELGDMRSLRSGMMFVRGLVKKAEKDFDQTEAWKDMAAALARLDGAVAALKNA